MRRHPFDLTSLVAGAVLMAVAIAYLVGSLTDSHVDARLVLPLGLVGLGVAGMAGALVRARRPDRPVESSAGLAEGPQG